VNRSIAQEHHYPDDVLRVHLGVLPLYFATGAGKLGRHSVGTAVVGGMLFSTILNLLFIPVLYVIVKTLLVSFSEKTSAVEKTQPEGT